MSEKSDRHCADHLDRRAVFRCPECARAVCVDCTNHAWTSTGFIDRCLACDVPLERLVSQRKAHRIDRRTYLERVPEAITQLGERSSLLLMAGLTLLTAPLIGSIHHILDPGQALIGRVLIFSLEAIVYLAIIAQTAQGKDELHAPDVTDVQEDVFRPTLRYLAASLPILIGVIWFATESTSTLRVLDVVGDQPQALFEQPLPALLVVFGIVMLPLMTIVAATCYSIMAVLHPLVWLRALRVIGGDYFPAMILFLSVLGIELFFWLPWLYDLYWQLNIPVLGLAATTFLGYLPMFLRGRMLGMVIQPRYQDLL